MADLKLSELTLANSNELDTNTLLYAVVGGLGSEESKAITLAMLGTYVSSHTTIVDQTARDAAAAADRLAVGAQATANAAQDTANLALPKSGGTMTGFVTLHADPTADKHATTKEYVDGKVSGAALTKASNADVDGETDDSDYMSVLKTFRAIARKVKNASNTVRGIVLLARNEDVASTESDTTRIPTIAHVKTLISRLFLPLTGGTLTGKLTLDGDPTSNLHATTKAYADFVASLNANEIETLKHITRDLHTIDDPPAWSNASDSDGDIYAELYTSGTQVTLADSDFNGQGASITIPQNSQGVTTPTIVYVRLPLNADLSVLSINVEDLGRFRSNVWSQAGEHDDSAIPTSTTHAYYLVGIFDATTRSIDLQLQKSEKLLYSEFAGLFTGEVGEGSNVYKWLASLAHLTSDLYAPKGTEGWVKPSDDTKGGICLNDIPMDHSDIDGKGDSDYAVEYTTGFAGKYLGARIPDGADPAFYRIRITGTNGSVVFTPLTNYYSEGADTATGNWDLYISDYWTAVPGNSVAKLTLEYTETEDHAGTSRYLGGLSGNKIFTATGLTSGLVDRLKASLERWVSTKTYSAEYLVVDNHQIWVSRKININKQPGVDTDGNWATLLDYLSQIYLKNGSVHPTALAKITVALADRLVASVGKYSATATYAADAMVVDAEFIWVSQKDSNTGNSPATDDGTNWVTLAAWVRANSGGANEADLYKLAKNLTDKGNELTFIYYKNSSGTIKTRFDNLTIGDTYYFTKSSEDTVSADLRDTYRSGNDMLFVFESSTIPKENGWSIRSTSAAGSVLFSLSNYVTSAREVTSSGEFHVSNIDGNVVSTALINTDGHIVLQKENGNTFIVSSYEVGLVLKWVSGKNFRVLGRMVLDPHNRPFVVIKAIDNSTTSPAQDPEHFKFMGGVQIYADSEAFPKGAFVEYNSKVYWVNTAVGSDNTTKPDKSNSFTELGAGSGGVGAQGPQGAFYLELRQSASSKPAKPTALSYNYDDDTFSVTPTTWKLKDTFTPTAGDRVWEVRAAIDPRNDAGKGSIDILSRLGNVLPITGEKGANGSGGGGGAYKHYDSLPDPDSYDINDLIEFGGHSLILQETYATADTFAAETGTADVHTGREVIDKYIGIANADARDVYAPTGLWTSNPGNEIAYIMEHDGTVEMGVLRSAYRTAKGSNEAANDVLKLRMTINSTTETLGLTYTPNLNYESESFGYRSGYDYLVFRGTVSGGGNFVLQSQGEGEEATFIILNSGETANFFTHDANSKHWVLYHELDAVYNELLGREANQKVDDAILGLNAVQSRVRALDFDFNEAPKATVTIDGDTVTDGRKDPAWTMDITDVEAQNDILVIEWENFDSIEYTREHALPGSTDAAGRMYIHLSDELLHQNTAYDFLGRSVNPMRVNNGDGTFTNVPTTHGAGISIHRTSTGFQVQITPTHAEFDSSTNVNNLQPPANFSMTIKLYGQESLAALDGSSLRAKLDEVEEDVSIIETQLGGFTLEVLTETAYTNLANKDDKVIYFTYDG